MSVKINGLDHIALSSRHKMRKTCLASCQKNAAGVMMVQILDKFVSRIVLRRLSHKNSTFVVFHNGNDGR